MTIRHVLLVLAGMSLLACASDEPAPQDANDENRDVQHEARAGQDGNLAAHHAEQAPTPDDAATPSSPTDNLCEGVAQPETCPLAAGIVRRSRNIEGGALLILRSDPSTMAQLERRIRCFDSSSLARSEDAECLFSLPGVSGAVSEDEGRVHVRLVTTDASQVRGLRDRARLLARHTAGSAHGSTAAEATSGNSEPGGDVRGSGGATGSSTSSP